MAITVNDIRNKQFKMEGRGYNCDEVDDFLAERVWDFPNKHFALQNRHLYVQMHCLLQLYSF